MKDIRVPATREDSSVKLIDEFFCPSVSIVNSKHVQIKMVSETNSKKMYF
jgi:hypothetical protein